jgi:hypothetical protein
MLTALFLLAIAQTAAAPAPAPAPGPPIDVTASVGAYIDWRMCLDGRLGPPPRPRQPTQAALEAAFAACRSHEDTMRTATTAAFGPAEGAGVFERFVRGAREELGASPARR